MICVLALIADILHSVRHRNLWFPCRYTSLNAASLTVLAIAVKLSMDLTTPMPGIYDQFAKRASTAFLCVSTAHFMPSLGSMSSRDVLLNLTALGILIVTLSVNVIIEVLTDMIMKEFKLIQLVIVFMTVYTFIILCSCALTVFTSKRYLEHKYNELHTRISTEEPQGSDLMDFDRLKSRVKKYWAMAKTSNPQFVLARSEATGVLFMICFISYISSGFKCGAKHQPTKASDYKWSVYYVFRTQHVGLALCVIVSLGRLSITLHQSVRNIRKCTVSRIALEIKNYKIKRLVQLKKRPPPLQVRSRKLRKIVYYMRNLLLNILIGTQIVIVITNKLLVPISICGFLYILITRQVSSIISPLIIPLSILMFSCILRMRIIRCLVILKRKLLREPNVSEEMLNHEEEIRNFVLLLESETINFEYLTFINAHINSSLVMGAKNQPRCLMKLIDKASTSFQGVLEFESDQVSPMLIHKEPPNCWSLTISTIASIITALPNIQHDRRNLVLESVIEGFKYVRLVEKTLDVHKTLETSTIAADSAWVVVELRCKWLDVDLKKIAGISKTWKETLERLAYKSEEILKRFMSTMNGDIMETNPINLPDSVIIANSMYKISNTLLLDYAGESYDPAFSDAQLFEKLSVITADILVACLSNLPHVILKKCSDSTIEEREKIIRDATHLLGETQGIMQALQKHEIPSLSHDQLIYIDEWRALLKHTNHGISDSTSSSSQNISATSSSEVNLDIHQLCSNATAEALESHGDNAESSVSGEAEESGVRV